MFDEINTPYSFELEFYAKNNIPLWECKTHETKNLGRIYEGEDGGWIECSVMPMPAQFFKFTIYSAEENKGYVISTGSGKLEDYFGTMVKIAEGMICVDSVIED